ncbi:MAG TPA: hypothetical protein VE758_01185, partial [Chthoniobacterales bacterium]|nr:hypothetical protein [Chthoniobacterales bacterium]
MKKNLLPLEFALTGSPKPNQAMEKPMIRNVLKTVGFVRASFAAAIGMFAFSVYAQERAPGPAAAGTQPGAQAGGAAAEVERVIVTGSNIPTAEEVGPNPVFSLNRDLINKTAQATTAEQLL